MPCHRHILLGNAIGLDLFSMQVDLGLEKAMPITIPSEARKVLVFLALRECNAINKPCWVFIGLSANSLQGLKMLLYVQVEFQISVQ